MNRRASVVAVFVAWVALALAPRGAHAQTITINNTITRTGSPRSTETQGGLTPTVPIGLRDCTCESWTITGTVSGTASGANPRLEFWIGTTSTACATLSNRAGSGTTTPSCWQIPDDIVPSQRITTAFTVVIPSALLVNPVTRRCEPLPERSQSGSVFLSILARGPDDMTPMATQEITYNLQEPESPSNVAATAQESAASITWTIGTSATSDSGTAVLSPTLQSFYVLCFPGAPTSFDAGAAQACTPVYVGDAGAVDSSTVDDATDASIDATDDVATGSDVVTGTDVTGSDGSTLTCGEIVVPSNFDPNDDTQFNRYRCSTQLPITSTMFTVQGLDNGQPYRFGVVTQDTAGNRSVVSTTGACVTPQPVTDFWEHYHGSGGLAQPGFCAIRPGPVGWKSIVPIAFGAVGVVAWRRRRAKKRGASAPRGDA